MSRLYSTKILSLAAISAALLSTSALAADVYTGSSKDSPAQYAPDSGGMVNWSGLYIGGQIGYGNANHDLTVQGYDPSPSDPECEGTEEAPCAVNGWTDILGLDGLNSSGFIGGGRVGFDVARGRFLFGVFGEYNVSDMKTELTINGFDGDPDTTFGLEKGDEWSAGARLGYIVAPRTLAYILAAYTQTDYDLTGFPAEAHEAGLKSSQTFDGVTVGGGVEFAMSGNVFLGLEATHTFYGEETLFDTGTEAEGFGSRIVDDLDETRVLATIKLKLNADLPSFGN